MAEEGCDRGHGARLYAIWRDGGVQGVAYCRKPALYSGLRGVDEGERGGGGCLPKKQISHLVFYLAYGKFFFDNNPGSNFYACIIQKMITVAS